MYLCIMIVVFVSSVCEWQSSSSHVLLRSAATSMPIQPLQQRRNTQMLHTHTHRTSHTTHTSTIIHERQTQQASLAIIKMYRSITRIRESELKTDLNKSIWNVYNMDKTSSSRTAIYVYLFRSWRWPATQHTGFPLISCRLYPAGRALRQHIAATARALARPPIPKWAKPYGGYAQMGKPSHTIIYYTSIFCAHRTYQRNECIGPHKINKIIRSLTDTGTTQTHHTHHMKRTSVCCIWRACCCFDLPPLCLWQNQLVAACERDTMKTNIVPFRLCIEFSRAPSPCHKQSSVSSHAEHRIARAHT